MYYTSTPPATQDAGYMATNIAQRNRTLDSAWLPNIPTTIFKFLDKIHLKFLKPHRQLYVKVCAIEESNMAREKMLLH